MNKIEPGDIGMFWDGGGEKREEDGLRHVGTCEEVIFKLKQEGSPVKFWEQCVLGRWNGKNKGSH